MKPKNAQQLAESCLRVAESFDRLEVPIHLLPNAGVPLHNGHLDAFGYVFADLDGLAAVTEASREEERISEILGVDDLEVQCPGIFEASFSLRALGDWPVFYPSVGGGGGMWFSHPARKSKVLAMSLRCLANELMAFAGRGEERLATAA